MPIDKQISDSDSDLQLEQKAKELYDSLKELGEKAYTLCRDRSYGVDARECAYNAASLVAAWITLGKGLRHPNKLE